MKRLMKISIKKKLVILLVVVFSINLYAKNQTQLDESKVKDITVKSQSQDSQNSIDDSSQESKDDTPKKKEKAKTNLDAMITYGMYNSIYTSLGVTQSIKRFSYQLNAFLMRSGDFGFANSNYYNSEVGFTGKIDPIDSLKITPELEVVNKSHGMFDNTSFQREENDKIVFTLKNEYTVAPSRFNFNIGGIQYIHLLEANSSLESNFFKLFENVTWEYIWSGANSLKISHKFVYYFYIGTSVANDYFTQNKIFGSFKLGGFLKATVGGVADWNLDSGFFPSGFVSLVTSNLKHVIVELNYSYKLLNFKPEDFYFKQKYFLPSYNLPPGKSHNLFLSVKSEAKFKKKGNFSLKKIRFKALGRFLTNDNYYNYIELQSYDRVLGAETISVLGGEAEGDLSFNFRVYDSILSISLDYKYNIFKNEESKNLTYLPDHSLKGVIKFKNKYFEIEFGNKFQTSVYTDPNSPDSLPSVIIGSFVAQYKPYDGFSLYLKIDNLYNYQYFYRKGYSEPGIVVLGGLKVVL